MSYVNHFLVILGICASICVDYKSRGVCEKERKELLGGRMRCGLKSRNCFGVGQNHWKVNAVRNSCLTMKFQ